MQQPNVHVLEIGCGYGSSLLPVLKANPTCHVTACDVSPTAVQLLLNAAHDIGAGHRVHGFAMDGATGGVPSGVGCGEDGGGVQAANGAHASSLSSSSPAATTTTSAAVAQQGGAQETPPPAAAAGDVLLANVHADVALLVFTLSALLPHDMHAMLVRCYNALRPGGRLLVRDYGLYDMPMLRFTADAQRGPCLYVI